MLLGEKGGGITNWQCLLIPYHKLSHWCRFWLPTRHHLKRSGNFLHAEMSWLQQTTGGQRRHLWRGEVRFEKECQWRKWETQMCGRGRVQREGILRTKLQRAGPCWVRGIQWKPEPWVWSSSASTVEGPWGTVWQGHRHEQLCTIRTLGLFPMRQSKCLRCQQENEWLMIHKNHPGWK